MKPNKRKSGAKMHKLFEKVNEKPSVMERTMGYLSATELLKCRLVCLKWHAVATDLINSSGKVSLTLTDGDDKKDFRNLTMIRDKLVMEKETGGRLTMINFRRVTISASPSDSAVRKFAKVWGNLITNLRLDLKLRYEGDDRIIGGFLNLFPNLELLCMLHSVKFVEKLPSSRPTNDVERMTDDWPLFPKLKFIEIQVINTKRQITWMQKLIYTLALGSIQSSEQRSFQSLTISYVGPLASTAPLVYPATRLIDVRFQGMPKQQHSQAELELMWKFKLLPFWCANCTDQEATHLKITLLDFIRISKHKSPKWIMKNVKKITLLAMNPQEEEDMQEILTELNYSSCGERRLVLLLRKSFPQCKSLHLVIQKKRVLREIFTHWKDLEELYLTLRANVMYANCNGTRETSTRGTASLGYYNIRKMTRTKSFPANAVSLSVQTKIDLAQFIQEEHDIDWTAVETMAPSILNLRKLKCLRIDYRLLQVDSKSATDLDEDDFADELRPMPTGLFVRVVLLQMNSLENLSLCFVRLSEQSKMRVLNTLRLKSHEFIEEPFDGNYEWC